MFVQPLARFDRQLMRGLYPPIYEFEFLRYETTCNLGKFSHQLRIDYGRILIGDEQLSLFFTWADNPFVHHISNNVKTRQADVRSNKMAARFSTGIDRRYSSERGLP